MRISLEDGPKMAESNHHLTGLEIQLNRNISGERCRIKQRETIILEGVCYKRGVYQDLIALTLVRLLIPCGVALPLFLPLLPLVMYEASVAAKKWYLILTPNIIYYQPAIDDDTWAIPLSFIEDITTSGTKICLCMKTKNASKYIKLGSNCCLSDRDPRSAPEYTNVVIEHVENYEDFVDAVQGELLAKPKQLHRITQV